jgi:hypothetical protein
MGARAAAKAKGKAKRDENKAGGLL